MMIKIFAGLGNLIWFLILVIVALILLLVIMAIIYGCYKVIQEERKKS